MGSDIDIVALIPLIPKFELGCFKTYSANTSDIIRAQIIYFLQYLQSLLRRAHAAVARHNTPGHAYMEHRTGKDVSKVP